MSLEKSIVICCINHVAWSNDHILSLIHIFGFTAALPAVVGFIVIIIMVKYYEKKEKKAAEKE